MELVDRLVEEMPAKHQDVCIRVLATLAPAHRRVFTETLLDQVDDEKKRLKAFKAVEMLQDTATNDDEAAQAAGPLVQAFRDDPTEAVHIVDLHPCFPEHRWRELPELPCPERSELLEYFAAMTNAEQKKVGRACGKLLPMDRLLLLLRDLPPNDVHCPLCRVKRAHREQYLLEQNIDDERRNELLRQPFSPDVYAFEARQEPEDKRNPPKLSILARLGLEDSAACVIFDPTGYDVRIDTALICGSCRREIYGVMAHLANDRESRAARSFL